ncbi:MAG: type I-B CRISPR-associated protein Cas5 [Clostridia bacterium]|nr:type I-B CRISPR-associated protein Cas5 [Clostridia bacterium]
MKILKLNLFQETACYKKPFAYKVAETYPLPPYSTVIGMFHKILQAKPGEYFPMNISIQGEFESIFSNYQTLRMFKGKDVVTAMPRNVHQLLNINLVIHIEAEDQVIDKIYNNILMGEETFTLGRNEDLVRVDGIKILKEVKPVTETNLENYNAYVPKAKTNNGINYRLNTVYKIDENNLRRWEKIDVKYIEKDTNETVQDVLEDEDGDLVIFYK